MVHGYFGGGDDSSTFPRGGGEPGGVQEMALSFTRNPFNGLPVSCCLRGRCGVTVAYGPVEPSDGVRLPAAAPSRAEVAQHGQRRRIEVPIS